MKPFRLALLPCTKTKNPHGLTAQTLYSGGAFSLMMRHAQQRADRIMILSAKYGLLDLADPVEPYEQWLPDLKPEERQRLARLVEFQLLALQLEEPVLVISYLPKAYHEFFRGVNGDGVSPGYTKAWIYRRPFAKVAFTKYFVTFANEIKSYAEGKPQRR